VNASVQQTEIGVPRTRKRGPSSRPPSSHGDD
jgi:hypothetical protein